MSQTSTASASDSATTSQQHGNFIDGRWVPAVSGRTTENRNPADQDDLVGTFPDSGPEDVEAAVRAAREAFPSGAPSRPQAREILYPRLRDPVRRKRTSARAATREMARLAITRGYVQEAIDMTSRLRRSRRQLGRQAA